jgi:glutathione peroxidase
VASIHNISIEGINGKEIKLNQFEGKKLLIVNVASACGFTSQYEQLEELYRHFKERVVILGCPCTDFGQQEPGTEEEILSFCKTTFDVTFPLTKRINILSEPVHPLYQWLTDKSMNEVMDSEVKWNFQKYAIGPKGDLQRMFSTQTSPLDESILSWVDSA